MILHYNNKNIILMGTMSNNFNELEHDLSNLSTLFAINTIASQTGDVDDFVSKLSDYVSEIIKIDKLSFYLYENEMFKIVSTRQNSTSEEYFEYEEENEAFWAILNSKKLIKTFDDDDRPIFKSFLRKHDKKIQDTRYVRAFFEKKSPIAFCFIGKNRENEDLSPEDIEAIDKIFSYVEPILVKFVEIKSKEDKVNDLQKSLYNISILYNISQAVNFIDDLKRLLQVILSKALVTLEAEKGSLMLYDYSINALQVKVVYGLPDKKMEDGINNGTIPCSTIKAGEGIAGTVFLEKKAIITNLGGQDPRFSQKNTLNSTKTLLCVPLIVKNETIGVINISNKQGSKLFNQKDLDFMSSLANQAAIAIDNAKLYELATKDGLTKLYIYRHFYTLLENEIRRCVRYKHNMSLLMIDIDDFKKVNDTYGHLVGDSILREISSKISTTVRKIDTPARYGGEEFVVILPETTKNDALVIAERLRRAIESVVVETSDGIKISPTASFGIAQHPIDGVDPKSLIGNADTALYYSKHNGKNVISLYNSECCLLMNDIGDILDNKINEDIYNEINNMD